MATTTIALGAFAMVVGGLVWWFRRVSRVQIPVNRSYFLIWMLIGGALGALALVEGAGWTTAVPGSLALLGGLFVLATISISRQKTDGSIGVGDPIPSFRAPDDQGESFDSSSLAGQPSLIKFFRGHW